MKKNNGKVLILICLIVLWAVIGPTNFLYSAERTFIRRVYRESDGLRDTQVTSVTISPRGNVWVRHGELGVLSYLDGYTVRHIPAPPGNFRIYESRSGQLWSLYTGGLQEFKNEKWVAYQIQEIKDEFEADPLRKIRQLPLIPTKRDHILFLISRALMEFNAADNITRVLIPVEDTKLEKFIDMTQAGSGTIYITGKKGVLKINEKKLESGTPLQWEEYLYDPEMNIENGFNPVEDENGGLTVVVDSLETKKRISVYFDGKKWKKIISISDSIRQSWPDIGNTFWGITINNIFRVRDSANQYIEPVDLNVGRMFDVAVGKGGVFYVATVDGLYRFAPALWSQDTDIFVSAPVHSINQSPDGKIWVITADGLIEFEKNGQKKFDFEEGAEQFSQPEGTPYFLSPFSLALNINNNAHILDLKRNKFTPFVHPSGRTLKLIGRLNDGSLCFVSSDPRQPQSSFRIDLFDGRRYRHLMESTNAMRLGNEIYFAKSVSNGDIWIGGSKGVAVLKNKEWTIYGGAPEQIPSGATCMVEIETNKLWFGYKDELIEFDGKSWRIIRSKIDQIRGMCKAKNGTIWLATANGIYRYEKGNWVSYGIQEGLPSISINRIFEDNSGKIWACTTKGLAYFNPTADPDPPIVKITSPKDNAIISTEDTFQVSFVGIDKWKYTISERLYYSWKLSGSEWSEYSTQNNLNLRLPNSGTYQLYVKVMDRNMNECEQPAMVEFTIVLPWYKDQRLLPLAILGAIAVFSACLLALRAHLRLKRNYAEIGKIVQQKTMELEQATQQLLLSQKMTALGTLAAGIAHDFNNILSIIKGSAQVIESNLDDKEKILLRVQRIKTAVDQGAAIVQAMLGYSRTNNQKALPIDVNEVVDDTIKLLGERFTREVPIIFTPASPIPKGESIRDLLQQMVLNLILNAADAIQEKGYIEVTTGIIKQLPSPLVLAPEPAVEYIFISVKDTGCGIPPENLPRIFEPFFTTKSMSSKRGTGLGLTNVYQFAKELKYGLFVKSKPGEGSVFTIIIPVKAPKDRTCGQSEPVAEKVSDNPK
jgi:signal transduction histidine kinase